MSDPMSESHEIEQIARVVFDAVHEGTRSYETLIESSEEGEWAGDFTAELESVRAIARAILPLIRAAEVRGAENMRERAAAGAETVDPSPPNPEVFTPARCNSFKQDTKAKGDVVAAFVRGIAAGGPQHEGG